VTAAASMLERHRGELHELIGFGIVPAVMLRSGEVVVLASAIGGLQRRLCEHE
jgi:hypothetical protein